MTVEILKHLNCPTHLINHSKAVCRKALKLSSNFDVDIELVETGALLHDIGRSKTNGIDHAVVGAEILKDMGFPDSVSNIALRHIGAGIPKEEALQLGLPPQNYIPLTLEEKIVAHADNLTHWDKEVDLDFVIKKWKERRGTDHPSIPRIIKLHQEIVGSDIN
ncbi:MULTISPECIES: TIGR00295 family protein [Methanobacterium]|uniref:TIGR00295 family protein n=1 Tax=Methanobacterium veterum TaxID=408577 RepID=A0A9E5DJB2_9EURY|nr:MULTISPECIES: TIGR00295 family protein [Methanobacterium]MCZ3365038.1 TIGR00295 family protein [Methanobacterium veterum]MCZ3372793.1 TIGR00295 family protein [Methanobacterium veterum]